jgi:hypothetical protein
MRDVVVLLLMVLGLGVLITAQLRLVFVLVFFEKPRWRGLLALLVPPLAPWFGWRAGRRWNAGVWLFAAVIYALGRGLSLAAE